MPVSVDPLRLLGVLRSGGARVAAVARADHATINQRSLRAYGGVMSHAFLHAAVAPSRQIRPAASEEMGERAAALAGALGLPTVPFSAGSSHQTFAVVDDRGAHVRTLHVTRSGVLELMWALEQLPTGDGAWAVRAVDAGAQLARFAGVVGGEDYGRLLGASRWRRRLHSRVDWALGVTTSHAGTEGARGWRDILVIGGQPERASGHAHGWMTPAGYGAAALRGSRRSRAGREVVEVLIEEWLCANGYLRTSAAVERTVDAVIAAAIDAPGSPAGVVSAPAAGDPPATPGRA